MLDILYSFGESSDEACGVEDGRLPQSSRMDVRDPWHPHNLINFFGLKYHQYVRDIIIPRIPTSNHLDSSSRFWFNQARDLDKATFLAMVRTLKLRDYIQLCYEYVSAYNECVWDEPVSEVMFVGIFYYFHSIID